MEVSMRCWFTCAALCITLLVMSGSAESANEKESEKLAAEDAFSYYFSIEIMNRIYSDSLLDPDSPDYKKMYCEVSSALYSVFGCPTCPNSAAYNGVTAMSFRKGSVIADSTIEFKGVQTNPILLKFVFLGALSSNNDINGLQINPATVQCSAEIANMKKPASEDGFSYYFSIEIMNRIYSDSLLDPDSPDYKKMYCEVSSALYSVFGCPTCPNNAPYNGVTAMSFRKGSVIADSTIEFKGTDTNPFLLKAIFLGALSSNNEINGLQINPATVQDSYVTTTTPTIMK